MLSEYAYFYILKIITLYVFCMFLKSKKSSSVPLRSVFMYLFKTHSVHPLQNSEKVGLGRISIFSREFLGKRECPFSGGLQFLHKKK